MQGGKPMTGPGDKKARAAAPDRSGLKTNPNGHDQPPTKFASDEDVRRISREVMKRNRALLKLLAQ